MIASPPDCTDRLAASVRQGGWTATGLPLVAGIHWRGDGSAPPLDALRRALMALCRLVDAADDPMID